MEGEFFPHSPSLTPFAALIRRPTFNVDVAPVAPHPHFHLRIPPPPRQLQHQRNPLRQSCRKFGIIPMIHINVINIIAKKHPPAWPPRATVRDTSTLPPSVPLKLRREAS